MTETGFLEQKRISPAGLAAVAVLHAAGLAALLLAGPTMIEVIRHPPTKVVFIPTPKEPDPVKPKVQPKTHPRQQTKIDYKPTVVDLPRESDITLDLPRVPVIIPTTPPGSGEIAVIDPPKPPPPPVRREASLDPRYAGDLQPPYPPSEQRAGNEGRVEIRVLIGTDGRVKAAEKIFATSGAFYRATERQALDEWRFRPATVDGRPVESRKVLTVRFQLNG